MAKHYETELPEGYEAVYSIDVNSKKVGIVLNVVGLLMMGVVIALAVGIIQPKGFLINYSFFRNISLFLGMFVYFVLHELVHGAAYKCLTGQKLTFGLSASCAYCGVPNVYVYRPTAMVSLLAPFTVFSVGFLVLAAWMENPWDKLYVMFLFAVHFGGCVGDLYDTFLYVFCFRDNSVLMRDTGPKQTFYRKK